MKKVRFSRNVYHRKSVIWPLRQRRTHYVGADAQRPDVLWQIDVDRACGRRKRDAASGCGSDLLELSEICLMADGVPMGAVGEAGSTIAELLEYFRQRLTDSMVPRTFIERASERRHRSPDAEPPTRAASIPSRGRSGRPSAGALWARR